MSQKFDVGGPTIIRVQIAEGKHIHPTRQRERERKARRVHEAGSTQSNFEEIGDDEFSCANSRRLNEIW
ncbi:hypothetical protein DH2020_004380 [Rehmannia glutinosa]|uniref:Uncharacterized protein n=1 Tax=Rehmannia glutinosa TaxID=99300 RepID=A0ABR0XPA8_REHGL